MCLGYLCGDRQSFLGHGDYGGIRRHIDAICARQAVNQNQITDCGEMLETGSANELKPSSGRQGLQWRIKYFHLSILTPNFLTGRESRHLTRFRWDFVYSLPKYNSFVLIIAESHKNSSKYELCFESEG